jgi:hypothetical protein
MKKLETEHEDDYTADLEVLEQDSMALLLL